MASISVRFRLSFWRSLNGGNVQKPNPLPASSHLMVQVLNSTVSLLTLAMGPCTYDVRSRGEGGGYPKFGWKWTGGGGVSGQFGHHMWEKLWMGLDWEEFDMKMCLLIIILAQSGKIHVLAFLIQPSARLHRVLSLSVICNLHKCAMKGGYSPKMMSKGQGGIWKLDKLGQGEGGGQKSQKFCGRHMYTAPYCTAYLSHLGQGWPRVAADPCRPNSPIMQLSPYLAQRRPTV